VQEPCSTNVAKEERCCPIFQVCELRKLAEYVGIPADTARYLPAGLAIVDTEPLFLRDYNLCISCLRCVRICRDVRKIDALGFTIDEKGDVVVGTKAATLKDSGCNFCLSCVEVCPTGTLRLKFEDPRLDGVRITPCVNACPAGMDIPRYIREMRRGEFARAEAIIRETAPLPRVLGEVCFHPCEESCLRDDISESIAICSLKRAALERSDKPLWKQFLRPDASSGKKVAIIGAGPAGLTAAWFLRLKGHDVELFDSQRSAGGWLRNGIPQFRLAPDALDADIADIASLGVDFKMGVEIGKDITLDEIHSKHDAVLLAVGAREARPLSCKGTDLPGVENGLDLLMTFAESDGKPARSFAGETIVVIGGGNVAIDIARTALRLGPKAVHLYCLEERDEMPAHGWEIEEAECEGIVIHAGWGPTLISGDGKVERIDFRRCVSVFNDQCVFAPEFDESVTASQQADRVLVAIGQKSNLDFLGGVGVNLSADEASMKTSLDGIFAAGEVVSGPASVIQAIADGRRAASGIDRFLGGDGNIDIPLLDETELDRELGHIENFCDLARVAAPRMGSEEAVACLALVESGYSAEAAIQEAERCLRCDLRLAMHPAPVPPEAWLEFNHENVNKLPELEGVYQLLDENKVVYAIKGVNNLRDALSPLVDTSTKAKFFLFREDPMFSKAESELIQEYLKEHGTMPPGEGEDDLDDLF
jgi:NADPH-dependent glutamate synthase beta subunit-like oxidoreductase/ferredoxin